MIYVLPPPSDAVDQGDVIDACPVLHIASYNVSDFEAKKLDSLEIQGAFCRVLVLTQTCDLANRKTTLATVALVRDADILLNISQILIAASGCPNRTIVISLLHI